MSHSIVYVQLSGILYHILIYYSAYYTGIMSHVHVGLIFDVPQTNPLITNLILLILLLRANKEQQ